MVEVWIIGENPHIARPVAQQGVSLSIFSIIPQKLKIQKTD
jgi:hypothetical protein